MMRKNRRRKAERNWQALRPYAARLGRMLLAATALAGLLFGLNRALAVKHVHVEGNDAALTKAISEHITRLGPLDFIHARPASLRGHLMAQLPELADVRVRRVLPHDLYVTPIRRQPLALWQAEDGQVFLVDATGLAYRPIQAGDGADLPLLRCAKDDLAAAISIITALQQTDHHRLQRLSECIALLDGWQLNFDRHQRWLLPRSLAPEIQIRRVIALLQNKRWHQGDWRLDARMDSRWFIRHATHGGVI